MGCELFDDGNGVRGIMCRRGFQPRKPDLPEPPPGPDLRPGFPLGQRIVHRRYGPGVVVRRTGAGPDGVVEALFDNGEKRQFYIGFVGTNIWPEAQPCQP